MEEIDKDYNLNISRYVRTADSEEIFDLKEGKYESDGN